MCDAEQIIGSDSFKELCGNASPNEEEIRAIFNKFIPERFWIYGVNSPNSLQWEMQNALHGYCLGENGHLCSDIVEEKCADYTYSDLDNSVIKSWCSCYLPLQEYRDVDPGVAVECFEPCKNPNSVKLYDSNNQRYYCQQSSCVVDNININAKGGRSGEVTFNQVCPSCPLGNCRCVINDINMLGERVRRLNVGQNCGSDSTCYARKEDGSKEEVDCQSTVVQLGLTQDEVGRTKSRNYLMIWICLLGIIITIMILTIK